MKKFKEKAVKKKELINTQSFLTSAVAFGGQDSL